MATTRKTIIDKDGRTIEMKSTPDRAYDAAFDSYMKLHHNGSDNHTLTLVLKLHMNRVAPTTIRLPFGGKITLKHPDADNTLFSIKPWTGSAYADFKQEFRRHAYHWNDKFWLIPPAGFTAFDYKLGTRTVRPNIYCHLFVDIIDTPAGAHRTIDVVNLDRQAAARQLGKPRRSLNASDFRSHEGMYDSLDGKPVPLPFDDNTGKEHKLSRSTIAHEVGHAIGLPHSGVTKAAPLCKVAVVADKLFPSHRNSFPAVLKGADNSHACYGSQGPLNVGANVMGYGLEFDATNASPWQERLALHTGTKAADWKVSVKSKVAPKYL